MGGPAAGDDRRRPRLEARGLAVAALAALAPAAEALALAALIAPVRAELWLRDKWLGLLLAAPIAAALAAPALLRRAGPRAARLAPLAGAALAVLATALSGAARGFWTLLLARGAAGLGAGLRGRALGPWGAGAPAAVLAAAAAFALAAAAERVLGWRGALAIAALPGLATAGLLALRRGPGPGPGLEPAPVPRWRDLDRTARAAVLAGALRAGALAALVAWLPAYLERSRGVPRPWAALHAVVLLVMGALAGAIAAGPLRAALVRRLRAPAPIAAAAVGLAAAAPLLLALLAWGWATHLAALVAGLGLLVAALVAGEPGPDAAALARAQARLATLAGALLGPGLVGALSDRTSLGRALLAVPAALALAAAVEWSGRRRARAAPADGAAAPVDPPAAARQRGSSR